MNNIRLAQEYLEAAHKMCDVDPLLEIELGVLWYHQKKLSIVFA